MSKPAKWMRDAAAICHASDCVFVEHDECGPDIDLLADVIARHYAPTQQAVERLVAAVKESLHHLPDSYYDDVTAALADLEKLDAN